MILPPGAHIAPFFVLNDRLDTERLIAMVNECAESGFDAIILHPRPGLRTPYLSKSWFAAIECCLEAAKRIGLKVWLYDEFPYPSGAAGGRVVQRNFEFAEKHLSTDRYLLKGGEMVTQVLGNAPILEAFLIPAEKGGAAGWRDAKVVTSSVGMRNTTWISSTTWDSRYYYSPDHALLYGCPRSSDYLPEQVFEDELPAGDWTLIVFSTTTGGSFVEPFGHYVDLSNADATEAFLEETHERYRSRFSEDFGSAILGVFTDEPKFRNSLPWSSAIADAWENYQEDPRALLSLLPELEDEDVLRSYRYCTSDLFHSNWIVPIRKWCTENSLGLIGHISPEEDWWDECRCAGSILRHLREFSVPGCDIIIPAVGDRSHPVLNFTPSLAVSAAAQSGSSHALCEVFGCSNYSLDMQTVKRVADWLMVSGINFIVPHGCFYSLAGLRRYDAPPTFLSPSTLPPFLAEWSAHVAETAKSLGPRPSADLAIVRPMSYLFGLSEQGREEARAIFQKAIDLVQGLLEKGLSFHWVDDFDLLDAKVEDGAVRVGCVAYTRLVIWPELASSELSKWGSENRISILSPAEAMALEGPLECPEGEVRAARNALGQWFCVNLSPTKRRFTIAGHESVLDGYESRWIEAAETSLPVQRRMILSDDWIITPPQENTFRILEWTCNGEPRIPGSGYDVLRLTPSPTSPTVFGPIPNSPELQTQQQLVYEATFSWQGPGGDLSLCFEEGMVAGTWTCFFNDVRLNDWQSRTDAFGGSQHPVAGFLKPGTNRIRLEVTARDAREGLWLEPVLRGQFQVGSSGELRLPGSEVKGEDWSLCGYPHFSGSMEFEQSFQWDSDDSSQDVLLVFTRAPAGMVEVILNQRSQGFLLWSPWQISLRNGLQPGKNQLKLKVTNTLHNFVSGHAQPSGILDGVEIHTMVATASVQNTGAKPLLQPEEVQA